MWTFDYIISQVLVIIAMILLAITFFIKNKALILVLSGTACLLYAIQYLLIGAYTGMALDLVAAVRAVWFFICENKSKTTRFVSLIIVAVILVVLGFITFSNLFDLLIICAAVVYTYSLWQKNIIVYRYLALSSNASWLIYNAYHNTVFGIVCEGIMCVVGICGIINFYITQKREKTKLKDASVLSETK